MMGKTWEYIPMILEIDIPESYPHRMYHFFLGIEMDRMKMLWGHEGDSMV